MKGCADAAKRDYEATVTQAWLAANFANAGSKLKALSEYLPKQDAVPAAPVVKPEVILDAMLTMQTHGMATVRRRQ